MPETGDFKHCPFCGETIRTRAVICRFCRMDLRSGRPIDAFPAEIRVRFGFWDGLRYSLGAKIVMIVAVAVGIGIVGWFLLDLVEALNPVEWWRRLFG